MIEFSRVDLILNAVFGLLPLLFIGNQVWMGLLAVVLVWWLSLVYFKRKLGGVTGDCLGATQQLSEVVFYLCLGLMLVFKLNFRFLPKSFSEQSGLC